MLLRVPAEANGEPKAPSWRAFWSQVFESTDIPDDPERRVRNVQEDGRIDAAMACRIGPRPPTCQSRGERLDQLAFGLRAFAASDDRMLADVLVAVRAFPRYRMLMLTLERMGIANPAVYAAAARHAVRLSDLGAEPRVRRARPVPERARHPGEAGGCAGSRCRTGGIAGHVVVAPSRSTTMAPMAAASPAGSGTRSRPLAGIEAGDVDDFDAELIASLAGRRPGARLFPPTLVSWEQRTYALDLHDIGGTAPDARARNASSRSRQPGDGSGSSRGTAFEPEPHPGGGAGRPAAGLKALQAALDARAESAGHRPAGDSRISRRSRTPKDLREDRQVADSRLRACRRCARWHVDLGRLRPSLRRSSGNSARGQRRSPARLRLSARTARTRALRTAWVGAGTADPTRRPLARERLAARAGPWALVAGAAPHVARRAARTADTDSADKDIFTKTIALLNVFELRDTDRDAIADGHRARARACRRACRPPETLWPGSRTTSHWTDGGAAPSTGRS